MKARENKCLGKFPIVVCECGEEILVISDLKEMVRCIQAHATTHMQKGNDYSKDKAEYDRIEELLTREVIVAIANMTNKDSKT